MKEQETAWERERGKIIIERDRLKARFYCVFKWLELLEDGTDLQPYFQDRNCARAAIYGAAEIGGLLLKEMQQRSAIEVPYFLDRNAERQREKWGVPVYLPEEFACLPEVDMVVVTALLSFEAIQETLLHIRPDIPVVSLETIIGVRKDEVWYNGRR